MCNIQDVCWPQLFIAFFLFFPTFTVMACLIDVQVVVLLTCFQKLTARVETWKLIAKKCRSDDAIDQFQETWTGTSNLPIFLAAFYTRVGIFIFSQSVTGNTSLCMLFTIGSFHPFFSWNFRIDIKEMARHEWQPKELHLVNLLGWLCYFLNLFSAFGEYQVLLGNTFAISPGLYNITIICNKKYTFSVRNFHRITFSIRCYLL